MEGKQLSPWMEGSVGQWELRIIENENVSLCISKIYCHYIYRLKKDHG